MNPNITLTLATEQDAELIHLMKYEAFLPLYEIYRDDETSPVKEPLEKIIAILEQKASEYYIIKTGNLPAGAIRVCHRKRDYEPPEGEVPAYISPLFILPRFQNRGIAQTAVKWCLTCTRKPRFGDWIPLSKKREIVISMRNWAS